MASMARRLLSKDFNMAASVHNTAWCESVSRAKGIPPGDNVAFWSQMPQKLTGMVNQPLRTAWTWIIGFLGKQELLTCGAGWGANRG